MKIFIYIVLIIAVLVGGFYALSNYIYNEKQADVEPSPMETGTVSNYKDATYVIEGQAIKLTAGFSEIEISADAESKLTTQHFGNEAFGDLDGDGAEDAVFLLTQDGGGTGIFYYVVVALKKPDGYIGTNAVFLGDRIAPQTTEIRDGKIIVNYAERKEDEPMTAQPSIGVSKYLMITDGILEETEKAGL